MPPKKRTSDVQTVQTARGRLKGALQDAVGGTEDEEESNEQQSSAVPNRGRPPKRFRKDYPVNSSASTEHLHQSFIMKLFDRSVDLAKYSENTALYPICRAWMINQPRSNKLTNFKIKQEKPPEMRECLFDIVEDLKDGSIIEVTSMPACNYMVDSSRIPTPTLPDSETINLDYDLDNPPISRAQLLNDLKKRSVNVRKKWQDQSQKHMEVKYANSLRVLEHIYKK